MDYLKKILSINIDNIPDPAEDFCDKAGDCLKAQKKEQAIHYLKKAFNEDSNYANKYIKKIFISIIPDILDESHRELVGEVIIELEEQISEEIYVAAVNSRSNFCKNVALNVINKMTYEKAENVIIKALEDSHYSTIQLMELLIKKGRERATGPLLNIYKTKGGDKRSEALNLILTIRKDLSTFSMNDNVDYVSIVRGEQIKYFSALNINYYIDGLSDNNKYVRQFSAEALGKFKDSSVMGPIIKALSDKEISVRLAALKSLKKFDCEEALEALFLMGKDEKSPVRDEVLQIIFNMGKPVLKKIFPLFKSSDRAGRRFSLEIFHLIIDSEKRSFLIPVWEATMKEILNPLIYVWNKGNKHFKRDVVNILFNSEEKIDFLCMQIQNGNENTQNTIKNILIEYGEAGLHVLKRHLQSQDKETRLIIENTFIQLEENGSKHPLIQQFKDRLTQRQTIWIEGDNYSLTPSLLDFFSVAFEAGKDGDYSEAIKFFDLILKKSPKNILALINKTIAFKESRKYKKALKLIKEALKIEPKNQDALSIKANILYKLKDFEKSLILCEEILKINQKNSEIWNIKGLILHNKKCYKNAIHAFTRAVKTDQKNGDIWNNMGLSLYKNRDYEAALKCYTTALKFKPYSPEIWFNQGICIKEIEGLREGIKCFDKALEIDPDFNRAIKEKEEYLSKIEKYKMAAVYDDSERYYAERSAHMSNLQSQSQKEKNDPFKLFKKNWKR